MAKRWTITVRDGPRVQRAHFDSLRAAIDAMQQRLKELEPKADREVVQVLQRKFEPARQVVARAEVSGPGGFWSSVHGGVDLRGDGSSEAYTGHVRRSLVALRAGEDAFDGLRRALGEQTAGLSR
ncbi:MAG TPA: hypothetical protein VIC05_09565 [Solirubrobacteraceae bacterium]|jgi:hypothetical protein